MHQDNYLDEPRTRNRLHEKQKSIQWTKSSTTNQRRDNQTNKQPSFPHEWRPHTSMHTPLTNLLGAMLLFTRRFWEQGERGVKTSEKWGRQREGKGMERVNRGERTEGGSEAGLRKKGWENTSHSCEKQERKCPGNIWRGLEAGRCGRVKRWCRWPLSHSPHLYAAGGRACDLTPPPASGPPLSRGQDWQPPAERCGVLKAPNYQTHFCLFLQRLKREK